MNPPNKGTGTKTSTHHIDDQTYQVRRLTCGNREHCNVCKEQGGHVAVYLDTGGKGGQRWKYVGPTLPESDPDYKPAPRYCQRDGCGNQLKPNARRDAKYCSAYCRVNDNRQKSAA